MANAVRTRVFEHEDQLAAPVARFMRNRSFGLQAPEVQFFDYRMDLYCFSPREDQTVAVELKLEKWARAIEQALVYQLCADLVYVAMPAERIERVVLEELEAHGIGLLAVYQSRCREVVQANPSAVIRSHYRDTYVSILRGSA